MPGKKFIGLETATSLLISYESLALAHKKAFELETYNANSAERDLNNHVNYQNAFALLLINAAIIEGTLRSIISGKILDEINLATVQGKRLGRTEPSKAEALLSKYHSDIEMQGGWDKIKQQYSFYFDLSLSDFMGKDLNETISVMFTLRNVLAHGTTIISPKEGFSDADEKIYPYIWQRKLQQTSVYLEKEFGHSNIFENLSDYSMPEHFMNKTKLLFSKLEKELSPLPNNSQKTIDMIKEYTFGYVYNTK